VERAEHRAVEGCARPVSANDQRCGNPEEVLDAVFDFAEHMIEQQRAFAKQMLKAASTGQEMVTNAGEGASGSPLSSVPSTPDVPAATPETSGMLPDANKGR
jgi:hypothetical protein